MPSVMKLLSPDALYRWHIAIRAITAIVGGYVLATLIGSLMPHLLPMSKSDSVMTAILLSFLIYTGVILWVFSVRSAHTAWKGVTILSLLLAGILVAIKFSGVTS